MQHSHMRPTTNISASDRCTYKSAQRPILLAASGPIAITLVGIEVTNTVDVHVHLRPFLKQDGPTT